MNKQQILIDTNTLMAITELEIDIFSEIEASCDFPYTIAVLQGTIDELQKIKGEQRVKFKRAAQLALALLKAKNVHIVPGSGNVDELLVQHSRQGDIILTQDQELKKKLTKPYLTIRQKRKIIMIQ